MKIKELTYTKDRTIKEINKRPDYLSDFELIDKTMK